MDSIFQTIPATSFSREEVLMPKQPVIIKIWCREEDLEQTAGLVSWTVGHRIEIPIEAPNAPNTYFFVIVEVEQYDDEHSVRKAMGFDIISKVSGVIDWEILPQEQPLVTSEINEVDKPLLALLDDLPLPISIVQRTDGIYTWKWQLASGQAETCLDAVKAALAHVMKSYALIRSELIG
jgi:hypothetical protein